jgi:hypothetical protein
MIIIRPLYEEFNINLIAVAIYFGNIKKNIDILSCIVVVVVVVFVVFVIDKKLF